MVSLTPSSPKFSIKYSQFARHTIAAWQPSSILPLGSTFVYDFDASSRASPYKCNLQNRYFDLPINSQSTDAARTVALMLRWSLG